MRIVKHHYYLCAEISDVVYGVSCSCSCFAAQAVFDHLAAGGSALLLRLFLAAGVGGASRLMPSLCRFSPE